jgi:hypothetical protein
VLGSRRVAVVPTAGSLDDALTALREERIAAVFVLAPKPFAPLANLSAGDGLHFLPVLHDPSDGVFYPASLGAAAYPGLVENNHPIETVALDAVLVAPRWRDSSARQTELVRLTRRFFDRFAALSETGRHPKWEETNLAAPFDGVRRLKAAQELVAAKLKEGERANKEETASRERVGDAR